MTYTNDTFHFFPMPAPSSLPFKINYTDLHSVRLLAQQLSELFEQIPQTQPIIFVCIGTDRSTGDALGPLVGTQLKKQHSADIQLYGTLDEPVHAMNLEQTLAEIESKHPHPFIVGIDACLGKVNHIGSIQLGTGPLNPGAGVKKKLPQVGHIHITGTVNVGGFMEYFVLQNTRLSLVVNMSDVIVKAIYSALVHSKHISRMISLPISQSIVQ